MTGWASGFIQPVLRLSCSCCSPRHFAMRPSSMPTRSSPEAQSPGREFRPRPMKLSVFTAALQELTPRERRDAAPDLAIEEWLEFARQVGSPHIELSAALHPTRGDVAAAALLDPVAERLGRRAPF